MMPVSKTEAKIINYLYKHDDEGLYAAEIARELKVAKRTTYESLDSLEQKGIVKKRLVGKMRFYTLDHKWKGVAEAAKIKIAETDEASSMIHSPGTRPQVTQIGNKFEELNNMLTRAFTMRIYDEKEIEKARAYLKEAKKILDRKGS